MTTPRIIFHQEVDSTNSELQRMLKKDPLIPHGTTVTTRSQTAGRGQRGNKWESAPESNITMSVLLRPSTVDAAEQWQIAEAVSLAVRDFVASLLPAIADDEITVKWPNDIYVGDHKISGTLIENTLSGHTISTAIAGIGVNINQREFSSDAPNPISIWQLTATDLPLTILEERLAHMVLDRVDALAEGRVEEIHREYRRRLWRRDGQWTWITADGHQLLATVHDVLPNGHLQLLPANGDPVMTFAFKEVSPIL